MDVFMYYCFILFLNLQLVDKGLVKSLVEPRNWFIKQLLKILKRKTIPHVEEKNLGYDDIMQLLRSIEQGLHRGA